MRRGEWLVFALVMGLALVVRVLYVSLAEPMALRSDASGYDAAARRLIATGTYAYPVGKDLWFDDVFREDAWATFNRMPPNAFSMPGYAGFVAGVYRLSGTGPARLLAVRLAQACLGALTVALLFSIADTLLGRHAAWAALAFNALYPPSIWATQYLLTETLFTLLVVGQVALMVWAERSRKLRAYACLGVVTAAAVYVRPVAALVPALLFAFETYRSVRQPSLREAVGRWAARVALSWLVVALLMAPWVVRNQRLYGVFMPTTSASALPAVQGETIVRELPFPAETIPQLADLAPYGNNDHRFAEQVSARVAATLPPASLTGAIAAQLVRARMLAVALTSPFTYFSAGAAILSWPFAMQVGILALALIGLRQHHHKAEVVALLGGIPLYFVAVHWLMSILWSRYLYPAMPIVLVLAGAGLVAVVPRRPVGH